MGPSKSEGHSCTNERPFFILWACRSSGCLWFFILFFLKKKNVKNFKADFSCYRKTNIKALPLSGSPWPCLCVLPARCWLLPGWGGQDPSTSAPSGPAAVRAKFSSRGPQSNHSGRHPGMQGLVEGKVAWRHVQPLSLVGVSRLGWEHHTGPVSSLCTPRSWASKQRTCQLWATQGSCALSGHY